MGGSCWSVELICKEGDGWQFWSVELIRVEGDGWQLLVRRAHKYGRGWVDVAGP